MDESDLNLHITLEATISIIDKRGQHHANSQFAICILYAMHGALLAGELGELAQGAVAYASGAQERLEAEAKRGQR